MILKDFPILVHCFGVGYHIINDNIMTLVCCCKDGMKVEGYLMVEKCRPALLEIERWTNSSKIGDLFTIWWKNSEPSAGLESITIVSNNTHVTCTLQRVSINWCVVSIGNLMELTVSCNPGKPSQKDP